MMAARKPLHTFRHHARGIAAGLDAIKAGVAELVDALDLGSSDESCGGSSPSARTKRSIKRLPVEFLESLLFGGFAKPTGARPWPRVDHNENGPHAVQAWGRERKEDLSPCRSPKPSTRD